MKSRRQEKLLTFAFFTGAMVVFVIFSLIVTFTGYKAGFKKCYKGLQSTMFPDRSYKSYFDIAPDILKELTELKAVIENAPNLTNQSQHSTILVKPDKELRRVLRPNTVVDAYMLKTNMGLNFDPPVLVLKHESKLSNRLKKYLNETSRVNYSYSTDKKGFRRTLPIVHSEKQILMIGDSVLFGVGVDDESTIASNLQRIIGNEYKVINAGVGGYNGYECFKVAERMSRNKKYEGLIYVCCTNDFKTAQDAIHVLNKIKSLSDRFNNKMIFILETSMHYNLIDILQEYAWAAPNQERTHSIRSMLTEATKGSGLIYLDWTDIVFNFMKKEKAIFSRFSLYADHVHLSPLGCQVMAEKLYYEINKNW